MEKEELTILGLKNIITKFETNETNEYLYWGRNDNFNMYKTLFEGREIDEFKSMILNTIKYGITHKEICKYDLEVSCDDVIEVIETNKVENYALMNHKIREEEIICLDNDVKLEKLNFILFRMVLEINGEAKEITIIKKFNKPRTVLQQAIKLSWLGDKMKRINEDIIFLDNQVDAFEYDGKFYVFNRNNFNTIFKFKDMYCRLIDKTSDFIIESGFINEPEKFIAKCKENGHYVKKISKAIIAKGFENIKQHKDKIPSVIEEYRLNIKIDKNGKIVYEEDKVHQILDLVLEHCVISALSDKRAIAKALEFEGE